MAAILEIVYNNLKYSDDKYDDARNIVEGLFQNEIDSIDGCFELNYFVKTFVRKFFKSCKITFGVERVEKGFFAVNCMTVFSEFDGEDYDFIIIVNEPIHVYTHEDIPKDTKRIHLFTNEDSGYDIEFE